MYNFNCSCVVCCSRGGLSLAAQCDAHFFLYVLCRDLAENWKQVCFSRSFFVLRFASTPEPASWAWLGRFLCPLVQAPTVLGGGSKGHCKELSAKSVLIYSSLSGCPKTSTPGSPAWKPAPGLRGLAWPRRTLRWPTVEDHQAILEANILNAKAKLAISGPIPMP